LWQLSVFLDATDRAVIVAAANITGVRRVRDFTVKLIVDSPVMCALVYLPEGINPEGIALNLSEPSGATSLYTPEQYIILSGCIAAGDMYPARYFGSRNLASGDSIYLRTRSVATENASLLPYLVSYHIAFA
jgi:hypothetical protein